MKSLLVTTVISYLLGTIPFGYLLVRVFRGQDVRQTGSGNIGATNVSRTSPVLGVLTLVLDGLKGMAAVAITRTLFPGQAFLSGAAAVLAVFGHMFPLWLKFRGGKGVATGLGSWVGLAPKGVLVMVIVFVVMVAVFRYISLGSITAAAIFPAAARLLHDYHDRPPVLGFMAASSLLIIVKHHPNIRRLFARTENKFRQAHK